MTAAEIAPWVMVGVSGLQAFATYKLIQYRVGQLENWKKDRVEPHMDSMTRFKAATREHLRHRDEDEEDEESRHD